jgi:tetratricopeptide (TPR) repeat protein
LENDYAGALALAKKALDLDPKVPEAHFYYGILSYASHQDEVGYREIKTAMDMGRKWKNSNEPLVAANFFADSGHLDEAIDLYKASINLHENAEARLKLGIAYFIKGDRQSAYAEMSKGLSQTDITQSPYYEQYVPVLRELGLIK